MGVGFEAHPHAEGRALPAIEEPDLLVNDICEFFRPLRKAVR
jgi:hypothetical protein